MAFDTLGFDIIWLMVAAFDLTSAMSETNLGKRVALTLVTKFGKNKNRTLAVFVIVNFLLAFFVSSITARASLNLPIALVLLEVYQALPGESKYGKLNNFCFVCPPLHSWEWTRSRKSNDFRFVCPPPQS